MATRRVLLVDPDPRGRRSLEDGFLAEGALVEETARGAAARRLLDAHPVDVVVVSDALEDEDVVAFVRAVRRRGDRAAQVPIVAHGDVTRALVARAAGASDYVARPARVRDVLTLAAVHASGATGRSGWRPLGGRPVFHVVRALAAARRSGALVLARGERRAEVHLHDGDVTAARVGPVRGLAALNLVLLWPDASYRLRDERVARRHELAGRGDPIAAAERFLRAVAAHARDVAPGGVYDQDLARIADLHERLPAPVQSIVRLFDGVRALVDVLEDGPYGAIDTLRVARRLVALGALVPRAIDPTPPVDPLADGSWRVGDARVGRGPDAAPERPRRPRHPTPLPSVAVDWFTAVPRPAGTSAPPYAPVVQAHDAVGEIGPSAAASPAPGEARAPRPEPVFEGLLSGPARETLRARLAADEGASWAVADGPLAEASSSVVAGPGAGDVPLVVSVPAGGRAGALAAAALQATTGGADAPAGSAAGVDHALGFWQRLVRPRLAPRLTTGRGLSRPNPSREELPPPGVRRS